MNRVEMPALIRAGTKLILEAGIEIWNEDGAVINGLAKVGEKIIAREYHCFCQNASLEKIADPEEVKDTFKELCKITSAMLGKNYRDITDQFETRRRKRNEMTYEAGIIVSKKESQKAFKDGIQLQLLKQILIEVKKENPQLELDFKL